MVLEMQAPLDSALPRVHYAPVIIDIIQNCPAPPVAPYIRAGRTVVAYPAPTTASPFMIRSPLPTRVLYELVNWQPRISMCQKDKCSTDPWTLDTDLKRFTILHVSSFGWISTRMIYCLWASSSPYPTIRADFSSGPLGVRSCAASIWTAFSPEESRSTTGFGDTNPPT